jgi:hypothetical protein
VNSIEQKARVFCQIIVQEFHFRTSYDVPVTAVQSNLPEPRPHRIRPLAQGEARGHQDKQRQRLKERREHELTLSFCSLSSKTKNL